MLIFKTLEWVFSFIFLEREKLVAEKFGASPATGRFHPNQEKTKTENTGPYFLSVAIERKLRTFVLGIRTVQVPAQLELLAFTQYFLSQNRYHL